MLSIAAVDLDDTIVRSDDTISDRTLNALAAWEARGHHVIIATGRPPRMTRAIPDVLHHLHWICYNGVVIRRQDRILFEEMIEYGMARQIIERILAIDPRAPIGLEIDDRLYLNRESRRADVIVVDHPLSAPQRPVAKILMPLGSYREVAARMGALPPGVRALLSEKYDIAQIMPGQSSKARALTHLVEQLGFTMERVVAFGDDVNDVEMLREAGLGVAMANGVAEVKTVADRITATVDEDGVAIVLEELLAGQ